MGYKKKWTDQADGKLLALYEEIGEIINPLFIKNGEVDLSKLHKKGNLEYLLALLLNSKFVSSENKNVRSFGADDVIALKLEVEKNSVLKYWGKINWLSKPNGHKCFRWYQDPFYGLFKLENNKLKLVKGMFGDYDKNDLDGQYWIASEMNWMYDL
ncbi:hypothetical protein [Maribacter sp. 2307UL18-2]|uniref:hypothetical protein n=1 Tax=Maribacter sp. 2307UL18-2 TaxID=3386274 RepID=UPI0039BD802B